MPSRGYKVRSYVNGKSKDGEEYRNYSLTVPNNIAEALPKAIHFQPKMTDDGLLYVPVNGSEEVIDLPDWAKENENGNSESQEGAETKT